MSTKVSDFFTSTRTAWTCKLCKKELNKRQDGSQNGISYHLKSTHPTEHEKVADSRKRKPDGAGAEPASKKPTLQTRYQSHNRYGDDSDGARRIHRAITQWITVDCVPLDTLEKPGFKNLLKKLRPQFQLKGRNFYARNELPNLYEEYEHRLRKELADIDHVSIAIDAWSDDGGEKQVIGVLVFFQSRGLLVHRVLDVIDVNDSSHTADLIPSRSLASIEKYGLIGKVAAVIRDGEVELAGGLLDIPHYDCFNHRLHLAVMEGIDALGEMKTIIEKFKKIARKLKKSFIAEREMNDLQSMLDLPPYSLKKAIDIRWNSIYDMLRRAIDCKLSLCLFLASRPDWPQISNVEWESMQSICEVLASLKDVCDIAQARGNLASSIIPVLTILIERMDNDKSCAAVRAAIKTRLESILEVYKKNEFLVLATCLDPRFKLNFVDASTKALLLQKVCELMEVNMNINWIKKAVPQVKSIDAPIEDEEDDDPFRRLHQAEDEAVMAESNVNLMLVAELEVEKWIRTAYNSKTNTFAYWNDPINVVSFPNLHKLAQIYHSAPPGIAVVERTFSTNGFVLNELSKSLTDDNFDMLLKCNKNIQIYGLE